MAAGRTAAKTKKQSRKRVIRYGFDGTAARQPETVEMPRRQAGQAAVRAAYGAQGRTLSDTAARNRRKALSISKGYIVFIALAVAATVFMCVRYLQLKETITVQNRENRALRAELIQLQNENDAYLESVENSIDWAHVKDVALHELGMQYASRDQVIWYNTGDSSFVRQYRDVSPS